MTKGSHAIMLCMIGLLEIECSHDAARRAFDRGEQFLAAGQTSEAIIEFNNAVNRDERWGQARYKLAEAYAAHGAPEFAYRHYLRAADLMPDDGVAQLKATMYLLLAGQYEDAKTRAQRLLAKEPRNIDAQIAFGNALAGLRDLNGALAQINQAIQLDPSRSASYINLARVELSQGRAAEARSAFEKAIAMDEKSVAAQLAQANFQWSVGETAAAERSLKRALAIDDTNLLTHRALAAFYLAAGRPAEAEEHLKFVAERGKSDDAYFSLADYYMTLGRFEDARRLLVPLAAKKAARAGAEARLAEITYAAGLSVEAHRLVDAVLAREPNSATALVLKARWLMNEGKHEEALAHAKAATAANPRLVVALRIRAAAEAATGRAAEAIKSYLEVLRLNPREVEAQVRLSALHLARNEIDSAVNLAEEAIAVAPDDVDARLALVRALIMRDDVKLAREELAVLKRQAPLTAAVYVVEGSLGMRVGDMRIAQWAFERALELEAGSREALIGITTVDVLRKNVASARHRIESRLAARVDDPELLLHAAKVYLASGDAPRAEDVLRRAIALDPLATDSYALLARVLTEQKRLDAATGLFDETARREPTNIAARTMAAILVHTQGKVAEAKGRYEEILKLEPRATLAANNLAAIYAEEGENLEYAWQIAESAAERLPLHAGIRDTLGLIQFRRQRYGLAVQQFRQSVAAEPANPIYQFHLGLAYAKSGDTDRARDALRKAISIDPGLTAARQAFAAIQ